MRLPALLNRPAPPRPRQPDPEPAAPAPTFPPRPLSGRRFARLLGWLDTHRKLVAVVGAVLLCVGIGAGAGGDAGWLRRGSGAPAESSGESTNGGTAATGERKSGTDKSFSGRRPSDPDKAGGQAGRGDAADSAARGDGGQAGQSAADQAAARRAAEDRAAAQKLAAAQAADDRAAAERAARATGTQSIAMPDLVGRKLNEAISSAAEAGLTGVTLCRTPDGDTPLWWSNWRVTAQTVPSGTRIRPDHGVCLTAAKS